ncbi:Rv2175c family DNA-binding protein [Microbacterium sp. YY-01]|uniref:Rv2175c family DNA-binding protein n=1 Tax=Microbacterium sp. YY-01 TaxID=3421634 RepID=UPI003D182712
MVEPEKNQYPTEWLSIPDVAELLDETPGRVRRLLTEQYLVATRRTGTVTIPSVFIREGRPLGSLRGTLIALRDVGLSDDESIDWLLSVDDTMGREPIAALLDGHKSEVRRIARTLL